LITAGWLARRWRTRPAVWRVTLVALVAGLAIINATGVYAQLVAAHVGSRASSGSAERLWSKDQAASRLRHRHSEGQSSSPKGDIETPLPHECGGMRPGLHARGGGGRDARAHRTTTESVIRSLLSEHRVKRAVTYQKLTIMGNGRRCYRACSTAMGGGSDYANAFTWGVRTRGNCEDE
jgi:hypothetical protein